MSPESVGVLRRFGLKTVIDFARFGLESGLFFGGTTEVYEHNIKHNIKLYLNSNFRVANQLISSS